MERFEVYGTEIPAYLIEELITYLCEKLAKDTYSLYGEDVLESAISHITNRDY